MVILLNIILGYLGLGGLTFFLLFAISFVMTARGEIDLSYKAETSFDKALLATFILWPFFLYPLAAASIKGQPIMEWLEERKTWRIPKTQRGSDGSSVLYYYNVGDVTISTHYIGRRENQTFWFRIYPPCDDGDPILMDASCTWREAVKAVKGDLEWRRICMPGEEHALKAEWESMQERLATDPD